MKLGLKEFIMRENFGYSWGSFVGEASLLEGSRMEGVGAVVQHALRIVVGVGCGLDAQVAEHGVGFPASQ